MDHIRDKIRVIPNFPKEGIMFRDITTLIKDPQGLREVTDEFVKRYKDFDIEGIESRGFIFGAALALELGKGFIPIRKKGKLPGETVGVEYKTEYSTDAIEVHKDAILPGQKVLLVDDLIATGGSSLASCELIEKLGGEVVECAFVVDLPDLKGKENLAGRKIFTLVEFEGE